MLRKPWRIAALISGIAVLTCPTLSQAHQSAKVGPSGAIIFGAPQSNAAMTGTLRAGQVISIVEAAKAGFYRVALNSKYLGWVQESALELSGPTIEERHEPPRSYLGVFGGAGLTSGTTSLGLGVDGGFKLSPMWGLGIYFEYLSLPSSAISSALATSSSSATSTATGGTSVILAAAEFNFYIPPIPGLYVGVKAGALVATAGGTTTPTSTTTSASNTTTAPTTSGNASSFALGTAFGAGYDFPLISTLSVGAEGNYFFVTGDVASRITNLLASVKYIF